MEIQFNTNSGKTILTKFTKESIIPRAKEKVYIDDKLFKVKKVLHWFESETPKEYIEIILKEV